MLSSPSVAQTLSGSFPSVSTNKIQLDAKNTNEPAIEITGVQSSTAAIDPAISFSNDNSIPRWVIGVAGAETGVGDAGSNFSILPFSDDAVPASAVPFEISRSPSASPAVTIPNLYVTNINNAPYSGGGGGGVSSVTTTANDASGALNVTPTSGAVVASLKTLTAPVAGTYAYPTAIAVDGYGRAVSLAGGAPLSGVNAGTGISITGAPDTITNSGVTSLATTGDDASGALNVTPTSGAVVASLKTLTAPVAGTYAYPTAIAVDGYGRAVSLAGGAPLSGVNAGTGISITGAPDTITNSGTISIAGQSGAVTLSSSGGTVAITTSPGNINLETAIAGSTLVPYTGATQTVNLGGNDLFAGDIVTNGSIFAQVYNVQNVTTSGTPFSGLNYAVGISVPGAAGGFVKVPILSFIGASTGTYIVNFSSGEGNGGICIIQYNNTGAQQAFQLIGGSFSGANGQGYTNSTYGGDSGTGIAWGDSTDLLPPGSFVANTLYYVYQSHNQNGYGLATAMRIV